MHLERVIRIINLLDVPEKKRRFWPQHSVIVVDSRTRTVIDVIQHFENSSKCVRRTHNPKMGYNMQEFVLN